MEEKTITIKWGQSLPIHETENVITDTLSSPEEAEREYYSRIRKQTDRRGYEVDIPTCKPLMPMTCQEYKKLPSYQEYALQPKLDGIRCLISKEQIVSRRNTLLRSIPHIELYARHLPDGVILDGELIIPNTPLNIIEGYVMKQVPDLKTCKEIQFHIFDMIDIEAPFIERYKAAELVFEGLEEKYSYYRFNPKSPYKDHPYFSTKFPFKMVETIVFEESPTEIKIDEYFDEKIDQGHEGIIIRNLHGPYQIDTRSSHILKKKEFFDNEFEIIDVIEGKNKQGIFVCKTHDGGTFSCSFKGTHGIRKQQLIQRTFYIGKWLRVEHEGINPDTNKPRCPIGIHWFPRKDHD